MLFDKGVLDIGAPRQIDGRRSHGGDSYSNTIIMRACLGCLLHTGEYMSLSHLGTFPLAQYAARRLDRACPIRERGTNDGRALETADLYRGCLGLNVGPENALTLEQETPCNIVWP